MLTPIETSLVVLGSGPGGYAAAFRAADLMGGEHVVLIESEEILGGVCLNVGCIPSKALLHVAKVIDEASSLMSHGIEFGSPKINCEKLVAWKSNVVKRLTTGLSMLASQRKVKVVKGRGVFKSPNELEVSTPEGQQIIAFKNAIISVGSQPVQLPFLPKDPRIIDSTGALELKNTKGSMLIIGGGIIGLEMASVYHALGTEITVVELMDTIIPGCDKDVSMPLYKRINKLYKNIFLKTKVTAVKDKKDGLWVTFEGENAPKEALRFDQILVAVGRTPNGKLIHAEAAGVHVDERGFIPVDAQLRTNVSHIYAIGDVVGNPMLAHKASHQGHVAAEVVSGLKRYFDPKSIASVAYTDPEIAWIGLTETEAKAKGIAYGKGVFPWAASGRSLSMGRDEGMTKILFDEKTHRIIGAAMVGPNAGELAAEAALAIEMGCDAEDISLTIHPHPTLSETFALAAEAFEGKITDLYLPKKKSEKTGA
jgi:dihydrolipoamide dehydrogenase